MGKEFAFSNTELIIRELLRKRLCFEVQSVGEDELLRRGGDLCCLLVDLEEGFDVDPDGLALKLDDVLGGGLHTFAGLRGIRAPVDRGDGGDGDDRDPGEPDDPEDFEDPADFDPDDDDDPGDFDESEYFTYPDDRDDPEYREYLKSLGYSNDDEDDDDDIDEDEFVDEDDFEDDDLDDDFEDIGDEDDFEDEDDGDPADGEDDGEDDDDSDDVEFVDEDDFEDDDLDDDLDDDFEDIGDEDDFDDEDDDDFEEDDDDDWAIDFDDDDPSDDPDDVPFPYISDDDEDYDDVGDENDGDPAGGEDDGDPADGEDDGDPADIEDDGEDDSADLSDDTPEDGDDDFSDFDIPDDFFLSGIFGDDDDSAGPDDADAANDPSAPGELTFSNKPNISRDPKPDGMSAFDELFAPERVAGCFRPERVALEVICVPLGADRAPEATAYFVVTERGVRMCVPAVVTGVPDDRRDRVRRACEIINNAAPCVRYYLDAYDRVSVSAEIPRRVSGERLGKLAIQLAWFARQSIEDFGLIFQFAIQTEIDLGKIVIEG